MRIAILALLLLSSCSSLASSLAPNYRSGPNSSLNVPPSDAVLATTDYGTAPVSTHQDLLRQAIGSTLRDPESARYRFAEPERAWFPRYHFDTREPETPHKHGQVFGWKVRFGVNAKNGFGAYSGEKVYIGFFQDSELVGVLIKNKHKDIFDYPMWNRVR